MRMKFAFVKDPDCNLEHCWVRHLVTTGEAIEAWYKGAAQESPAYGGATRRRALVSSSKDITVIFRPLSPEKILIITAYETNEEATYHG